VVVEVAGKQWVVEDTAEGSEAAGRRVEGGGVTGRGLRRRWGRERKQAWGRRRRRGRRRRGRVKAVGDGGVRAVPGGARCGVLLQRQRAPLRCLRRADSQ